MLCHILLSFQAVGLGDQKTFAKDGKPHVVGVPRLGAPGDEGLGNLIVAPGVAGESEVGSVQ